MTHIVRPLFRQAWLAMALVTCQVAGTAAESAKPAGERPQLSVSQEADGVTVRIGGEVFARYLKRSGTRPVLWPVIGPTGAAVTRAYSVDVPQPGEETDHVHHRSVWFGYEGVNGFDFWTEPEPGVARRFPNGTIVHREFVRADSDGKVAVVGTRNDWCDPSGHAVCRDERLLTFGVAGDRRWIDFRLKLWSDDRPLKIIDSKEGAFAVRVASSMRVDAGLGGRIVDSRGRVDKEAWGQPAEWVDYHGPVDGEIVGIAIMTHPKSYRPEPRGFVRTYGLHAVNPFGVAPYTDDPKAERGGLSLPAGQPVQLHYRVLLHRGNESEGGVADAFADFARTR